MSSLVCDDGGNSNSNSNNNNEHESTMRQHHKSHCSQCVNLNACERQGTHRSPCPVVRCPNKCEFRLHQCKLDEHMSETCAQATIDCINRSNGCKFQLKRADLAYHLLRCPANVVRCSSFSTRLIKNKSSQLLPQSISKWPDPIKEERAQLVQRLGVNETTTAAFSSSTTTVKSTTRQKRIDQVFLEQDYANLRAFAQQFPLKFQRMYGYVIGLKLDNLSNSAQQNKFLFMRYLLKNVKSRIFKDIESENCVVFNDELGCSACQVRIRMLELKRFSQMKEKYKQFDVLLNDVDTLAEFVERKIHLDQKFLVVYNQVFLEDAAAAAAADEEESEKQRQSLTPENNRELYDQLLKRNAELLEAIELDPTLKLNVAKELPCEVFQLQYETYRTKDTEFATDCDQLVRRDEFNNHYSFYHNYLMPNCDFIEAKCPFGDYGCQYFARRVDFSCSACESVRLGFNLSTSLFVFNFERNKQTDDNAPSPSRPKRSHYWDLNDETTVTTTAHLNLLDLPFEVLYEIIAHLDSNSLFNLSITSKSMRNICEQFLQLRGVVYPKWCKLTSTKNRGDQEGEKGNTTDANNNEKEVKKTGNREATSVVKWTIEKYVYSFSKHINSPNEIKMTTNVKLEYYDHVKRCPYRVVRELPARVKIFPPFN